jgi:hypothetical protein
MGIDKIKKKKKPNQLVSKRKDGKRPGYYGSDDYGSGEDGQGGSSSSSSDNGGGDDNYMDYYVSPAPSYSVQDDLTDYATNVGSTASVGGGFEDDSDDVQADLTDYATNVMKTADPKGGFEDDDTGDSLYVSPTLTMKEKEFAFKPAPFQGPYVDARDDPFTTVKNTNTGFFDSGIGKLAKNVGKGLLTLAAPQIGGLAFGKTGYDAVNLGLKGKRAYDFAKKFAPNTTRDIKTAFTKDFQLGTGNKPSAGTGFDNDNDGNNNIIAKNVVASNVQKYTPAQANNVKSTIDLFEDVISKGEYQGRQLNRSQIAQVANKRSELMQEYDMIMESLV